MKKVKIKTSFPTTHFGHLVSGKEYPLPDHFADYVVKRLGAGEYAESLQKTQKKPTKSRKLTKAKE